MSAKEETRRENPAAGFVSKSSGGEYADDELLLISSLQHYLYCPRQFALIHLEQVWQENYLTADGRRLHERVDLPGNHRTGGRKVEYALPIASRELGICGRADAVEFRAGSPSQVIPVEYKRGLPKINACDRVQLCAQALCLEEMLSCKIPEGGLFYFESRKRETVELDEELRGETRKCILACQELYHTGITPVLEYDRKRCGGCSLKEFCMPPREIHSCRSDFEEAME